MRKYKAGDKIVLDVLSSDDDGWYKIGGEYYSWWENPNYLDKVSEPLTEYTEKLEKKNQNKQKRIEKLVERLHRQASEITRLLAENEDLKNSMEIIRDNAFEAGQVKGQNDAWELAQKIASMKTQEAADCFPEYNFPRSTNGLLNDYTYTEAAAKVAEWEKAKEEIHVGDVFSYAGGKCVVTSDFNGIFTLLWDDGSSGNHGEKQVREYKKVGHIDVDAWLAQIGGEE